MKVKGLAETMTERAGRGGLMRGEKNLGMTSGMREGKMKREEREEMIEEVMRGKMKGGMRIDEEGKRGVIIGETSV